MKGYADCDLRTTGCQHAAPVHWREPCAGSHGHSRRAETAKPAFGRTRRCRPGAAGRALLALRLFLQGVTRLWSASGRLDCRHNHAHVLPLPLSSPLKMNPWSHLYSRVCRTEPVLLMAVDVLDALVAELIEHSQQTTDHRFLDWVADELTPSVEAAVTQAMQHEAFIESLNLQDPRVVLQRWVRHWVCPQIHGKFSMYAVHCPCSPDAPIALHNTKI